MNVLNRLFRRQATPAAPGSAEDTAALTAPGEAGAANSTATAPTAPEPRGLAQPGTLPHADLPEQPEVPLRSLQRYRQDPGFKNFMAKAQKRPGAGSRRPGIPIDYFDADRRPR